MPCFQAVYVFKPVSSKRRHLIPPGRACRDRQWVLHSGRTSLETITQIVRNTIFNLRHFITSFRYRQLFHILKEPSCLPFSQADSTTWAPGNPAILPVTDEGAIALLNLSARILKLVRTVADLAERKEIQSVHLAEALHA